MSCETPYGIAAKTLLYRVFGVSRQAVNQASRFRKSVKLAAPSQPRWTPAEVLRLAIQRVVGEHKA